MVVDNVLSVDFINSVSATKANNLLLQCCSSESWVKSMLAARPFFSADQVCQRANLIWQELSESDYLQAFDGHPKIGDLNSLKHKYQGTKVLAEGEQASVTGSADAVVSRLTEANEAYECKFGFIFIICASGKTAEEILNNLEKRIVNDRADEIGNAADQQREIFQLRLKKLLLVKA